MKKYLVICFILCTYSGFTQSKYAVIFSRLPQQKGEGQTIARNNVNLVKDGLLHQGFPDNKIVVDTIGNTKGNILQQLQSLKDKIEPGDFVFLYFDLPMAIDQGEVLQLKLMLDQSNPKEFILASEVQTHLDMILKKIGSRSSFFALFDSDSPAADSMRITKKFGPSDDIIASYLFAVSPGEKSQVAEGASIFARAVALALGGITDNDITYRIFYNSVRKFVLSYTTRQTPQYFGNELDRLLFNGMYVRYKAHFTITEKPNDSTVIINAGERTNVFPGTKVKFYHAFSDTTLYAKITEGVVVTAGAFTSTIRLNKSLRESGNQIWAYITSIQIDNIKPTVAFNKSYNGNKNTTGIFNAIIAELKNSGSNTYSNFVLKGGDIQVSNIIQLDHDSLEITFADPQSGEVYAPVYMKDIKDISGIRNLCRQLAYFEYLLRLTNYIPELIVDFKMTDTKGLPPAIKENGFDILYEEEEMVIKIINNNSYKLYYALLDLTQDKNFAILNDERKDPMEYCIKPFDSISLNVTISAPFGRERLKVLTSLSPINLDVFRYMANSFRLVNQRGVNKDVKFENVNIQDYDFEARSNLFSKNAGTDNHLVIKITDAKKADTHHFFIKNPSYERIYFNLLKQKADGSYQFIFPNTNFKESECFVNYNGNVNFSFTDKLYDFDQLITIYADRPFNLNNYTSDDKQLNDLLVDIARYARISGTPLNKIGLVQELYLPGTTTASRDGENVFIKLVTPKASNERGFKIQAQSSTYDINGFAMSNDNKPVKLLKINGDPVSYDANLKFFEKTVSLANGINKVVIEATDEKGFTATKTFDLELKNNVVEAASKGKNYFLGIGIDAYKTWPLLNNAKNDIFGFSSLLKNNFGFDSTDMFLLLDTAATRKNIINRIRYYLSKAGPNDNVIIYLSGHGNEDQLDDGGYYFIPQEADADDVTSAVKSSDIMDNFKKIRAKRCLLIVDACYSGMITNNVPVNNKSITSSEGQISLENEPCKWIITSGRATKVSDGEKGKNSPFATILINYLKENNEASKLKITSLISFLSDKMPELNKMQQPLGVLIDGRGEWIFKKNDAVKK